MTTLFAALAAHLFEHHHLFGAGFGQLTLGLLGAMRRMTASGGGGGGTAGQPIGLLLALTKAS